MKSKPMMLAALLLSALFSFGQYSNLKFSPEQPKPGDKISFEYSNAGTVLGEVNKFEAIAYLEDGSVRAQEVDIKKEGDKWTGTIKTNDTTKAVLLVFKSDELTDNNKEQGYTIMMMENGNAIKGAQIALTNLYGMGSFLAQLKVPQEKSLELFENEFSQYPDLRLKYLPTYTSMLMRADKDHAAEKITPMIKEILTNPVRPESDYEAAMWSYTYLKDNSNADKVKAEMLAKYPKGNMARIEMQGKFNKEPDPVKKEGLLNEFLKTYPPKTEADKQNCDNLYYSMAFAAAGKNDWPTMKKYAAKITNKERHADLNNEVAWKLVGEGMDGKAENLDMAKDFSAKSLDYMKEAKEDKKNKPTYFTVKVWEDNLDYSYGNMSDTYGLILWKMNDFEKAYKVQQKAMEKTKKGNTEINERYIIFKEKVEGPASVKTELEDFIKDGKSTPKMKELLKSSYLAQNHSEEEYNAYLTELMKAFREKLRQELLKKMIDEAAPSFALKDLGGNSVSLAELRGKVVVVDFWATWCGPCRASFPGMQTTVTKYKDDPDVKFVFVDTWENKQPDIMKKEADEFVKKNKYDFHVLLDADNKVVESFAVGGIPTKFVIDPNNRIRFRSVGFLGSADQLVDEMSIMIEAVKQGGEKKGF